MSKANLCDFCGHPEIVHDPDRPNKSDELKDGHTVSLKKCPYFWKRSELSHSDSSKAHDDFIWKGHGSIQFGKKEV